MITGWILQTLAVGLLLSVAASAADRALRVWQRQARYVWAGGMMLSVALPLVALGQALGIIPRVTLPAIEIPLMLGGMAVDVPGIHIAATTSSVDLILVAAWTLVSLGLSARLLVAWHKLRRRRATWRPDLVDGVSLLVSRDAGPAVVGFRTPAVVIPEWVLNLDYSLRTLVLRHEREHVERGDNRLLLGAVVLAVLAPWNLALWFQFYRLRSAIELDCDLRVLRAHPNVRTYGSLLLAVAQRGDRGGLLAPALTESTSLLGRRIAAMRREAPTHRPVRTVALVGVIALMVCVACDIQSPGEPTAGALRVESSSSPARFNEPVYREFALSQSAVPEAGSPQVRYPDILRRAGVEGEVLIQLVVRPDGTMLPGSMKVLKSSHDLFTRAVASALPQMTFKPAMVGNTKVSQLLQMPFTFSISR